jgi:tRNA threonylcarbamoyladenosine biosynthesis protein TsaB
MSEKSTYKIYLDSTKRYEKRVVLVEFVDDKEKVLGEKSGDIDLVVSIKELLEANKLEVPEIAEVVPNLGPGSFTGLKIGVTVANVINWLNGKKIKDLDVPNYGRPPNITLKKF